MRFATNTDIENKRKETFQSEANCSLCSKNVWVKNIRVKNILCPSCKPDKEALKRRNYFHGSQIPVEERVKLVRRDSTVKQGPFFAMKKG